MIQTSNDVFGFRTQNATAGSYAPEKRIVCVDKRGRVTVPWEWRMTLGIRKKIPVTIAIEHGNIVIRKAVVKDGTDSTFTDFVMEDVRTFVSKASYEQLRELMTMVAERKSMTEMYH